MFILTVQYISWIWTEKEGEDTKVTVSDSDVQSFFGIVIEAALPYFFQTVQVSNFLCSAPH